jgi:UPF0271 protein
MDKSIDLNCDLGESYGAWALGDDEGIMPFISSANIACGFHAGDPGTIHRTVMRALRHSVAIGAHPSYPDLAGFGRRRMDMDPQEVYDTVLYQLGAVAAFAKASGTFMRHVKPHGALYNHAAKDTLTAQAILNAVKYFDDGLLFYGPAGSELEKAALAQGIFFCAEAFADRGYQCDGSLTPRSQKGALLADVDACVGQAMQMVEEGCVTAVDGSRVPIRADTICIHGDGPMSVGIAEALHKALESKGYTIRCPTGRT